MKKEKKGIRCSYAVLVIILFAALAFVTDYAYIQNKVHKCSCPKCPATTNTITDDTIIGEDKDTAISISDEEALKIGNELFVKMGEYNIGRGPRKLDSNGKTEIYIRNDDNSFSITDNSNGLRYYKLDKDKLGLIATEDYIRDYSHNNNFISYNGEAYGVEGDRGSNISYIDTKLEILLNTKDTIIFNAVSSYFTDFSYNEGLLSFDEAPKEYKTNTFRIVKEGNEWKISEFHGVY